MIKRGTTKKIIALSACLPAMCHLFTGRGGTGAFEVSTIHGETGLRMEYGIPDMEATAEQMLTEGDQVHFSISDSDGNADVIVALKGEKPVYKGTEQENAAFILTASKTGSCRVSATGRRAKG